MNSQCAMPFRFVRVTGSLVEMKQSNMGQNEIGVQVDHFLKAVDGFVQLSLHLVDEC